MPRWEPQKISTKLCRLFDGGYCTVADFARLSGESVRTIEWVTNHPAAKIDRELEMSIGKVLSTFMRANPELYDTTPPAPNRGVLEDESPREDERIFTLRRRTNGKWFCTIRMPADEVDDTTVAWLWRVLEKKEGRHLKAI